MCNAYKNPLEKFSMKPENRAKRKEMAENQLQKVKTLFLESAISITKTDWSSGFY